MQRKAIAVMAAAAILAAQGVRAASGDETAFNEPGNVLISDQFNNRVVEVDAKKHLVWSFGSGGPAQCTAGAGTVIAPNDVERLAEGLTLIAGTGTGSCPDNRVIVVDQAGNIVWQYGQGGVAGSSPGLLNVPVFAIETPSHTFLITDQANNRIIEVDQNHNIVYEYNPPAGNPGALNNPNSAELLGNGNILIADENNSRVLIVDPQQSNKIVFQYSSGLNIVAFASRLKDGHTLITDSGNNRIIEIDNHRNVIFTYATNKTPHSVANPNPSNAVRLANGNTLIADQFNNRVFIITPAKRTVFQYGQTGTSGIGGNQLYAPYNAVVVGDYTGVTSPPSAF